MVGANFRHLLPVIAVPAFSLFYPFFSLNVIHVLTCISLIIYMYTCMLYNAEVLIDALKSIYLQKKTLFKNSMLHVASFVTE